MHKKVKDLTLEEKASLMSGENFWNTKPIERLGILGIMLTDGPHGVRKQGGKADHLGLNKSLEATCYPTASTLANSWDEDLLYEVGELLGAEAAHHDISVLLGPGINIKRNPLCGRNFEYFSEDPYLTGKLASSMIVGMQENNISACVKHFAVNSQEHVRMSIDEIVDKRALHELYLEAFRMTIKDAGVKALMTSYNRVNGIYANEHPYLLKDVLKGKWNFDGLVVTDWGGNNDRVEALRMGNQLEMPSASGMTDADIVKAVKDGSLDEKILDENVESYLRFVDSVKNPKAKIFDLDLFHNKAIEAAKRSIVLLKNEAHVLPLDKDASIALIGDFAETPRYQGAGSSLVNPTKLISLRDSLEGYDYAFAKGYHRFGKYRNRLFNEAMKIAREKDIIILSLGLDESREAEVVDRSDMKLSSVQLDLVFELAQLNKPLIVLLSGGAPIEIPFADDVDAIVHGYLGGQGSGEAMRQVLFGEYNPSGRLAETYPLDYSDVISSEYYPGNIINSQHRESIFIGYRQYDYLKQDVRYEFGYGLSYTDFSLSDLQVNGDEVSVNVKNTGNCSGETVVQVYVGHKDSNILRAPQELKGFKKLALDVSEEQRITIKLHEHAFKHFDVNSNQWETEAGDVEIKVGFSSRDIKLKETVSVQGIVYDKNIPDGYQSDKLKEVTQTQFEALIEQKIAPDVYDKSKALDYNSIILETKYHSGFGKFINGIIDVTHHTLLKMSKPIAANNVIFAQNLPFRGMARMSNGLVDMDMLDGIIMMFDKQFAKGLNHTLRSFRKKRKNDKKRD